MAIRPNTPYSLGCAFALFLFLSPFSTDTAAQGLKQRFVEQKRFNEELSAKDKMEADAYYHLGIGNLQESSNSDIAVEHLEKAVGLDETNGEYHYRLAEAYLANFEYVNLFQKPFVAPKVRAQLELAVQYDPSSIRFREALIQYYVLAPGFLGGSYEKARKQADEIARRNPYLGMLAHAGILSEEGEGDRSLELYRKAMRSQPKSWEAYHRLGMHYLNAQETDDAIDMFRKYTDVASERAESFNCLGQAYQQKQMYTEAISAFQAALEKDPSLAHLVFRIAQLYEFKGTKHLAREYYQRYLSMVPRGRAADDAREKVRLLAG